MNYIIIDIETTGFSPTKDRIIEFAAVLIDDRNQEIGAFSTLCKAIIPPKITQLTGITNADVAEEQPFEEYIEQISEFLGGLPLIGHNCFQFDMRFLKRYGIGHGNTVIDTLVLARKRLPQLKSHSLTSLVEYFKIPHTNAHRALDDARATKELYLKVR